VNSTQREIVITSNKIIINYAQDYMKVYKLNDGTYNQINHMRFHKKLLLPVKIVGDRNRRTIECYNIDNAQSLIE